MSCPKTAADHRPISITSVLCRQVERILIKKYIYPQIQANEIYNDQFAFRPSGSTTAAIIAITTTLINHLDTCPYVRLIAFDFSKAFDTVKHSAVIERLSTLNIPSNLHNWICCFLKNRTQTTTFNGQTSAPATINCGVVQGSVVGPIAFVLASSNLKAKHKGNMLIKYADDTYLIIPSYNINSTDEEIENVNYWAHNNNLNINISKSKELIIRRPRYSGTLPPEVAHIPRVDEICILGVTFNTKLQVHSHIAQIISKCSGMLYAIKILRSHGMNNDTLHQMYSALIISRMLYAIPAWWGFANESDKQRLQSFLNRGIRFAMCSPNTEGIKHLATVASSKLFTNMINNSQHCLHPMLPQTQNHNHNLRPRTHQFMTFVLTNNNKRGFMSRMLFDIS